MIDDYVNGPSANRAQAIVCAGLNTVDTSQKNL